MLNCFDLNNYLSVIVINATNNIKMRLKMLGKWAHGRGSLDTLKGLKLQ